MDISQSLKFHFYAYRKPFIIFWAVILFLATSVLWYINTEPFYKYTTFSVLLVSLVFTFSLGVYEFNRLAEYYISLKSIKKEFFFGSVAFSGIFSLLQIAGIILLFYLFFLLNKNNLDLYSIFPYNRVSSYLITLIAHIGVFTLAGTLTLLLRRIRFIYNITYIFLLGALSLFFFDIANSFINYVLAFYSEVRFEKILPLSVSGILLLLFMNHYLFINEKK